MSNAIIVPDSFKAPLASSFQGQQAGEDLSGGITGGYALVKYRGKVWSLQHNGNTLVLMRDDGDGPRGSIDIVILKANAQLSKTFYINGWDENNNNPPDCASANGIVPDQGVPAKQSDTCATCPKNAWGSAAGGGKGKACGDHRRMAVVPLTDLRNETFGGPMLLRCPAASLQDMAAFDSRYKGMGYPYFSMGLKIGFDPAESYPKFTFTAIRPLTEDEAKTVLELRSSPEVARVIHEGTAPAQAAVAAPQQAQFLEPPATAQTPAQAATQAPAAATQQVQVQQATQQANTQPVATQPAPVAAVAQPAAPVAVASGNGGGFGAVATAGDQPAVPAATPVATTQPATQPQRTMTGFGAVAPAEPAPAAATQQVAAVQQPAAEEPAPATPVSPAITNAFEGSIDERLQALLS